MAFIIESYDKYDIWDRECSKYIFEVNGNWYAIKEVEMEWGIPKLAIRIDRDTDASSYQVYDTLEDAMRFVQQVRKVN